MIHPLKELEYFLFPRTLRRLSFIRERAIVLVGGRAEVESRKGADMRVTREPMQSSYAVPATCTLN